MSDEDRRHREELLQMYRRRLRELERKEAAYGIDTPPQVRIEIEDTRTKITDIEAEQRRQDLQILYRHINELRIEGRWQAALNAFEELDRQQPNYPDPQGVRRWAKRRQRREHYYNIALNAHARGEWAAAIAALEALLAENPGDTKARALLKSARSKHRTAKFIVKLRAGGKAALLLLSKLSRQQLIIGLVMLLVLIIGIVGVRSLGRNTGLTAAPMPRETITAGGIALSATQMPAAAKSFPGGRIAFQSKRDGNYEIYLMNTDTGKLQNLTNSPDSEDKSPTWSPDGAQIAFVSFRDDNGEIYTMSDNGGQPRNITNHLADDGTPAWSPVEQRIAFVSNRDGENTYNYNIYVMNVDGSGLQRLTTTPSPGIDRSPTWSPDGRRIAFASFRNGRWGIYVMNADGTEQTLLKEAPIAELEARYPAWSPDGKRIAFAFQHSDSNNSEIYMINTDGSAITRLSSSDTIDQWMTWSPDGQWIAFTSYRDGQGEIYIMDAEGGQQRNLTNNPAPDENPAWSLK